MIRRSSLNSEPLHYLDSRTASWEAYPVDDTPKPEAASLDMPCAEVLWSDVWKKKEKDNKIRWRRYPFTTLSLDLGHQDAI